jgi:gliding motility-associated-like protein
MFPGSYMLTVTDGNGCMAADSIQLNWNPAPVVSLGPDLSFCAGGAGQVINATTGFATYLWSNAATSASITVNTSGSYSVIATDASGCIAYDTVVVAVSPMVFVSLGPDTLAICDSGSVMLDAGPGGLSYAWSGSSSTDQFLNVTAAGTYSVTVTGVGGCQGIDSVVLAPIHIPPLEVDDVIVCPGETATLVANAGYNSYLWSTGATTSSIAGVPVGNYNVTVTLGGCTLSDEADVSDDCNSSIQIPNVFTPNGDGFNDRYEITGINVERVELVIVDRWGRIVFSSFVLNASWDGKLNGNDLPEGVYYLGIKYKYKDELKEHKDELPITLFR